MTAADEGRWARLADDLRALGLDVTIDRRAYPGGISRSITYRLPDGSLAEVHDKWWSKNDSVWIGWQVHVEGRDSIIAREWPLTKNRSDVVAAFREVTAR